MNELSLYEKFNKLVEHIPMEVLTKNYELTEYIAQLKHELKPRDAKGGRPKSHIFNGRITVLQVDDSYARLRAMGIKNKNLAMRIVAKHYADASIHALKRHYNHWKHEHVPHQAKVHFKEIRWSDAYFQNLLKMVQN